MYRKRRDDEREKIDVYGESRGGPRSPIDRVERAEHVAHHAFPIPAPVDDRRPVGCCTKLPHSLSLYPKRRLSVSIPSLTAWLIALDAAPRERQPPEREYRWAIINFFTIFVLPGAQPDRRGALSLG